MSGYFRDEERTAFAFEGGWFHSGDLATIDGEGYITVVDRKKDMIKTGGENVASREVEEALYHMAPISEIAVDRRSPSALGGGGGRGRRAQTGSFSDRGRGLGLRPSEARSFKTPKRVVFAETLPKNPSGKLLKRQLRDAYAELFR